MLSGFESKRKSVLKCLKESTAMSLGLPGIT